MWIAVILGHLFWLSSNHPCHWQWRVDNLYHSIWNLLLHKDGNWPQNGGVTYQKGMQIILEPQIRWNVKVYIDDIVVKSKKRGNLLDDLKETFDNLRKYKMKFNPKKMCIRCFIRETTRLHGVGSGYRRWSKEGWSHQTIASTPSTMRNP
jgi:hypothetical protein